MSYEEVKQELASEKFCEKYQSAITVVRKIIERSNFMEAVEEKEKKIEFVTSRIKSPNSMLEKLTRKNKDISVKSAIKNLNDIAGVCIVCCYCDDVYKIEKYFDKQEGLEIIKCKDFIKKPKSSGYRSLHVIAEVELKEGAAEEKVKVEIQIRTVTMDAWARLDHQLRYKNDNEELERLSRELKKCSDIIEDVEYRMQEIHKKIRKI